MKINKQGCVIGATLKQRLIANSSLDAQTGCFNWQRQLNKDGYAHVAINRGKALGHRLAWQEWCGPIPAGKNVLHRCDNRRCINISHLFIGTQFDNMQDMLSKGRGNLSGLIPGQPKRKADAARAAGRDGGGRG